MVGCQQVVVIDSSFSFKCLIFCWVVCGSSDDLLFWCCKINCVSHRIFMCFCIEYLLCEDDRSRPGVLLFY